MKQLAGDESTSYRSTDHSGEIAWLRIQGVTAADELVRLACLAAADLLQCHDDTGISFDDWDAPRRLVEHVLGHDFLANGI